MDILPHRHEAENDCLSHFLILAVPEQGMRVRKSQYEGHRMMKEDFIILGLCANCWQKKKKRYIYIYFFFVMDPLFCPLLPVLGTLSP